MTAQKPQQAVIHGQHVIRAMRSLGRLRGPEMAALMAGLAVGGVPDTVEELVGTLMDEMGGEQARQAIADAAEIALRAQEIAERG